MKNEFEKIDQLKKLLFDKYNYIFDNEEHLSIEEAIEQIVDYYEDTIGCMPGNVYLFDKYLRPITCNQNVLKMLGYQSTDEFKQKTFEQMGIDGNWPKEAEQSFKKDTLEVIQNKKSKLNVEEPPIPGPNGEMIYFLSSRVPLFNRLGEVSGIVGVSIDITEIKKRSLNLQEALLSAKTASAAKSEFIQNMSRDLRTPLTGIIGMADIINRLPEDKIIKEGAKDIHHAGIGLLHLLNEIIETAQVESDEMMHKYCFVLKETVDALIAIFKPAIAHRGLRLETYYDDSIPELLFGQELLLHRIVLNLLSNAVKFTEHGTISLEVSLLQKCVDKVSLKIVVKDTGLGITQDKQEIIFDKFSRLKPAHENYYKGSGLGLYMAKQCIEQLGGEIKVNSAPGRGAQFTCTVQFKIPTKAQLKKFKPTAGSENINIPFEDRPIKKNMKHILLVEDSPVAQKVMQFNLQAWGYGVVDVAQNAQEALNKAEHKKYDTIYLDLSLPDLDGKVVAKRLRENAKSPNQHTPIIGLMEHANELSQEASIAYGFSRVLPKPLTELALQAKVEEVVVDWDLWRKRCGGHEDLVHQAFDITMRMLNDFKGQSIEAIQSKNYEALDNVVHKCYGGLKYCSLPLLEKTTFALQTVIRTKHYEEVANLHQQFIAQIDQVLQLKYNPK